MLSIASALALWLARAFFMGVLTSDRKLRVHGWYLYRDFSLVSIERLEIDGYSGGLNGKWHQCCGLRFWRSRGGGENSAEAESTRACGGA